MTYNPDASHMDAQYYSSAFVQDGMKNFFTRLEQARRRKKEDIDRLGSVFCSNRKLGSAQLKVAEEGAAECVRTAEAQQRLELRRH